MADKSESGGGVAAPGTLVLVAIFVAFFMLVLFVNLYELSRLWPVR